MKTRTHIDESSDVRRALFASATLTDRTRRIVLNAYRRGWHDSAHNRESDPAALDMYANQFERWLDGDDCE